VQNNERCLAFSPAVSQAFLEVSDLRTQFLASHLQYVQSEVPYYNTAGAARSTAVLGLLVLNIFSDIYIKFHFIKPVLNLVRSINSRYLFSTW
jgi:hypothetical protein